MTNKLIFLSIVILTLIGLFYVVGKSRKEREKVRVEEEIRAERQKAIEDSLHQAREAATKEKERREWEEKEKEPHSKLQEEDKGNSQSPPPEDYSIYINGRSANTSEIEIAVTIVEEPGQLSAPLSTKIANLYSQTGKRGFSGLLRSSFINNVAFRELSEGNSEIVDKLNLKDYTDYLAIGTISYTFRRGTLVGGTEVCSATLKMNIIPIAGNDNVSSFSLTASGNGVNKDQAKELAIENLINKYKSDHTSL